MTRQSSFAQTLRQTVVVTAIALAAASFYPAAGQAPPEDPSGTQVPPSDAPEVQAPRGGGCGCCSRGGGGMDSARPQRGPGGGMRGGEARGGQGRGCGQGCGMGGMVMGMRHGSQQGMGRQGRGGGEWMAATHQLVHTYRQEIVREIEEIEDGVVTVTRAPGNPEAAAMLQRHVGEMTERLENGDRVRAWDPLFQEIFDHHQKVEVVVEELEDGVRVTETSDDPDVVKLIQAHARKVDEFVARGPAAVHEPTALPADYRETDRE